MGAPEMVGREAQDLMTRPLASKRTRPAVEVVTVMVLVTPKVKLVEEKVMVAVGEPVVMVMVLVVVVSR